jgi:flagellar motor component MotA
MTQKEFESVYISFVIKAKQLSEDSRKNGLLSLEDSIDPVAYAQRDIFEVGLRLVIDGSDKDFIDKVLTNLVCHNTNLWDNLLAEIKKQAVLSIARGDNQHILVMLLNSYVSIPDDPITKFFYEHAPYVEVNGIHLEW